MDEQHDHEHHDHTARPCDVAVVGGSAAGLAAALQLGRQRRAVVVVDGGTPRNAPAAHMHGVLGHEGAAPGDYLARSRQEVRGYGVEVLTGMAVAVTRADDGRFTVTLDDGRALLARRVVAATGIVDELPDIPGVADQWGRDVVHCPFCHGFEVRDRRLVQIVTHPTGLHPTGLWRQLSAHLTVVLHAGVGLDDPAIAPLRGAGVQILDERVDGLLHTDDGRVAAVRLTGGTRLDADAVVVGTRFHARVEPFLPLGVELATHPSGLGETIDADPTGATSVPGLFAAGNVRDPSQQVSAAAADGGRVGAIVSFDLASEDVAGAARPSPSEAQWDELYDAAPRWSGDPNPALVDEVGALAPGRALDAGAGEGGDALWLATRGWEVTATDVSCRALAHLGTLAAERGLHVTGRQADATGLAPFEPRAYDLVSAHYLPLLRSPDQRGARNLLDAVAPGGTLLFVAHDPEPMRRPTATDRPLFDPDAYVQATDVAALLDAATWEVEVHERRPRRGDHRSPHVADIVLRARRRAG